MCILITSVTTIIYDDRNYRKKCQVSLIGRGTEVDQEVEVQGAGVVVEQ